MLQFDIKEFKSIKETVSTLPPKGIEVLNLYFLNEILKELKDSKKSDITLDMLTLEALKKMCNEKSIETKDFKNKEEYIKALS